MIKDLFQRFIRFVSRAEPVGGLLLTDSSFFYSRVGDGTISRHSLRLLPGMVESGRIKNRSAVVSALSQLKKQISSKKGKVSAIVALENSLIYSQVFFLPRLEKNLLAGAADLNMRMISPIDIKQAYYGYQVLGPASSNEKQIDLLAAFIPVGIVDEWAGVLGEAGFTVAAIEYQALSLIRALNAFAKFSPAKTYLVLILSDEGLDILLVKNRAAYFDYFYSWRMIQGGGKNIPLEALERVIRSEAEKVVNFSSFRFSDGLDRIYFMAPGLETEIKAVLTGKFPTTPVEEIFSEKEKIYPEVLESFGAALRGEIPRSRDEDITLAPVSVSEEYFSNQISSLISFWRSAAVAALSFFIFISLLSRIFLSQVGKRIQVPSSISAAGAEELEALENQARGFNRVVNFIRASQGQETKISPTIILVEQSAAATGVTVSRFYFQGESSLFSVNGSAASPKEIFDFKALLEKDPSVSELNLPLPSNPSGPENRSSFNLSFKLKL